MKQSGAHAPEEQTPAGQDVPLGWLAQVVVLVDGVQTWQALAGFTVPWG
jgi:hypothetical protein